MMGGVSPETCWASYKHGMINCDTLLHLVGFPMWITIHKHYSWSSLTAFEILRVPELNSGSCICFTFDMAVVCIIVTFCHDFFHKSWLLVWLFSFNFTLSVSLSFWRKNSWNYPSERYQQPTVILLLCPVWHLSHHLLLNLVNFLFKGDQVCVPHHLALWKVSSAGFMRQLGSSLRACALGNVSFHLDVREWSNRMHRLAQWYATFCNFGPLRHEWFGEVP